MKNLFLVLSTSLLFCAPSFALVLECGPLLYKGQNAPVGAPGYSVKVEGKKVVLVSKLPGRKAVETEMKPVKGTLGKYTAEGVDAKVKRFEGRISASITKVGNEEWSANCE